MRKFLSIFGLIFLPLFLFAQQDTIPVKLTGLPYFNGVPDVTPDELEGYTVVFNNNTNTFWYWNYTTKIWEELQSGNGSNGKCDSLIAVQPIDTSYVILQCFSDGGIIDRDTVWFPTNNAIQNQVNNIQTALGIANGVTNFGSFTGSTLSDNETAKVLFQELETAIEGTDQRSGLTEYYNDLASVVSDSLNLIDGDTVQTLNYYSNDNIATKYVVFSTNSPLTGYPNGAKYRIDLDNGLSLGLCTNQVHHIVMFGATPHIDEPKGESPDFAALQSAGFYYRNPNLYPDKTWKSLNFGYIKPNGEKGRYKIDSIDFTVGWAQLPDYAVYDFQNMEIYVEPAKKKKYIFLVSALGDTISHLTIKNAVVNSSVDSNYITDRTEYFGTPQAPIPSSNIYFVKTSSGRGFENSQFLNIKTSYLSNFFGSDFCNSCLFRDLYFNKNGEDFGLGKPRFVLINNWNSNRVLRDTLGNIPQGGDVGIKHYVYITSVGGDSLNPVSFIVDGFNFKGAAGLIARVGGGDSEFSTMTWRNGVVDSTQYFEANSFGTINIDNVTFFNPQARLMQQGGIRPRSISMTNIDVFSESLHENTLLVFNNTSQDERPLNLYANDWNIDLPNTETIFGQFNDGGDVFFDRIKYKGGIIYNSDTQIKSRWITWQNPTKNSSLTIQNSKFNFTNYQNEHEMIIAYGNADENSGYSEVILRNNKINLSLDSTLFLVRPVDSTLITMRDLTFTGFNKSSLFRSYVPPCYQRDVWNLRYQEYNQKRNLHRTLWTNLDSCDVPEVVIYENRNAVQFDGENDYVQYSSSPTEFFNGSSARTLSFWLKFDSTQNSVTPYVISKDSVGSSGWSVYLVDPVSGNRGIYLQIEYDGSTQALYRTTARPLIHDRWNHVSIVYTATHGHGNSFLPLIYVNGVKQGVSVAFDNASGNPFEDVDVQYVGTQGSNTSVNELIGSVDELCMIDDSLSFAAISEIYNFGEGINMLFDQGDYQSSSNVLLYTRMGENVDNNTLLDLSGNDYNGILINDAFVDTDNIGTDSLYGNSFSVDFDGLNDRLALSDQAEVQDIFDDGGSLSMWIKPTDTGTKTLAMKGSNTVGWKLSINYNSGAFDIIFNQKFSVSNGEWISTTTPIDSGAWNHVLLVYDNSDSENNAAIYVNGVVVSLTENSLPIGTRQSDAGQDLIFGMDNAVTDFYSGRIDDIGAWTRELSASEALQISLEVSNLNANRNSYSPTNLLFWYRNGDNDIFSSIQNVAASSSVGDVSMVNMNIADFVADFPDYQ